MGMTPPPRRPWQDWERNELRRLAARPDATLASIAKRLGRTQAAIDSQMSNLGIRLPGSQRAKLDYLENITFNGEPISFAMTGEPCARCGVKESDHHKHGCGQFAAEVRVRIK